MQSKEDFIKQSQIIHNNFYCYDNVNYVNNRTKVCIICPIHGEFWQEPRHHLNGCGCPKCSGKGKTTQELIEEFKTIHSDKYDYSKVDYVKSSQKVCVICPIHGEFYITPNHHLQGVGCPKCGGSHKSNKDEFINKSNQIHNNRYDYSKVEYKNANTKVCIICSEHGEFWQTPQKHLSGQKCPLCAIKERSEKSLKSNEGFITESNIIHDNKYNYSITKYIKAKEKVDIICPIHGLFSQEASSHLSGCGCPKCGNEISKAENDIMKLVGDLNPQQRNREILKGKEIDVYIPSLKLGIEYNGLVWHSERYGKDSHYHIGKLNKCNEQGINLIQIFEDEWINHRGICESKIKQICGLNTNPKIYGRSCHICEIIDKQDIYNFLDQNHIQGKIGFTIAIGAYYKSNLIGVMTFKTENGNNWELNRFATDINYRCIGVGGKLFSYFKTHYPFNEIKSFADRRWTINSIDNLYIKLGFKLDSYISPSYTYYNFKNDKHKRIHKFNFRKQTLHKQYKFPLTMTEHEMADKMGYSRIWDCGLIKYVYKKDS